MLRVRELLLDNPRFIVTATVLLVLLVLGVGDVAAAGELPPVDSTGLGLEGLGDITSNGVATDSGP